MGARRAKRGRPGCLVPKLSAWERMSGKLCFPWSRRVQDDIVARGCEAELRGDAFPSGAWEREWRCPIRRVHIFGGIPRASTLQAERSRLPIASLRARGTIEQGAPLHDRR